MDFIEKIVVVTGASSGIGLESAIAFASRGAKLVLVGRNKARLEKAKKITLEKGAVSAHTIVCDVSDYAQVKTACEEIIKRFGKVDVLLNNAGFGVYRLFAEQEIEELEMLMKTNYFGTAYFTKGLLPGIPRGGHVVNVSSVAGKLAFPNYSAYCASKFAVTAFTESLYHELLPKGIEVHLICPVGTKTHFFDNESFDGHPHKIHFNEMMQASEVARMIIDAVENNKMEVVPTLREKFAIVLKAVAPWLYHRIMQSNYVKCKIEKPTQ